MTKGNSSKWMVLCALLLVGWSTTARAAEGHDFSVYARAVEFCRGAVHRPMAVDLDRRVLCLDGDLTLELDLKLAGELEPNGLFVVRSRGGYINRAAELAEALSDRNASVVVYDYCFSACASYLAMATPKTFVMKDTVLAWHHPPDLRRCPLLVPSLDGGPERLENAPCPDAPRDFHEDEDKRISYNRSFYRGRADPAFEDPPESRIIRKRLAALYRGTGRYPDVLWTWNPRYYRVLKTQIVYEAYPESQSEIDALMSKFHFGRVLYDP